MPALGQIPPNSYNGHMDGLSSRPGAINVAQTISDILNLRDLSSNILMDDGGVLESRGLNGRIDTTILYTNPQKFRIQVLAATAASISVLVTLVTLYWFSRMRKRFRHMLVVSLILGDLIRASWYLIFVTDSLRKGTVPTHSILCQATGWWIQFGTEMIDLSVLFIAIHGAIHIYKPYGSDGLYKHRNWVYGCIFFGPILMASLAFVRTGDAYMSQGPFCSLPIRPFWYRLALAWIPRYIITLIILSLTIAIYVHVHRAIKAVDDVKGRTVSVFRPWQSKPAERPSLKSTELAQTPETAHRSPSAGNSMSDTAPNHDGAISPGRRASTVTTFVNTTSSTLPTPDTPDMDKLRNIHPPGDVSPKHGAGGLPQRASVATSFSLDDPLPAFSLDGPDDNPDSFARRQAKQRIYMLRQLRQTFIYPIIYLIMWFIPFVLHCFQYNNYYAQHPPYVLACLAVFCYTFMCTVDCLVFCLREKPWRHIPGNEARTVGGSFAFWRGSCLAHDALSHHRETPRSGSFKLDLGALRRESAASLRHAPQTGGAFKFHTTSDRQKLAAEQARERLAAEVADRRSQALSSGPAKAPQGPPKEWFERRESIWYLTKTNTDQGTNADLERDVEGLE